MRKISTLLLLVLATMVMAKPYGIMINGTDAQVGTQNPQPLDPSFEEWSVLNVELQSGDFVQLYDDDSKATWAVDLDPASVAGLTRQDDRYNVTADGCYDFYIKLKYQEDQLYVGKGNCGGGGGDVAAWYYKGYIDGADVEPSEATKFTNGIVEFACEQKSYLFVIYQEQGKPGVQFMTEKYVDGGDSCLLKSTASADKWGVEPFTGNLYLYYGDDATQVILSKVEIPGRVLVDTETALRPVAAEGKQAVKMIKNGQLMIQQGNNIVDVFGRRITK